MTADVLVVGTGLIGTSIALALRGQRDVLLTDRDPGAVTHAVDRGAGRRWDGVEQASLVVLAVPPSAVAPALQQLAGLIAGASFTHVSSVQAKVQAEVQALSRGADALCGGHPMAGKERSGPGAATGDLFRDRPWVLCPGPSTAPGAVDAVRDLAVLCGAAPVEMTPEEHDAAVALVSHLPQVAASAVAAQLVRDADEVPRPDGRRPQDATRPDDDASAGRRVARLAGPGLQDTTRIAASDPRLWLELLATNALHVAPLVRALSEDLADVARALEAAAEGAARPPDLAVVERLLRRGNAGRALVPVKRGERDRDFVTVAVSVPDRPGQLAGVLVTAAEAGINVEDVRVEHLPGSPQGVIELLVHASAQSAARSALRAAGWDALD